MNSSEISSSLESFVSESPYSLDKIVGSLYYLTNTPGVGGVLRENTTDFIVREISDFKIGTSGKYLIAELTKDNWDTHHFMKMLSRKLGISHKRISFAGTKDKRAITTQLMSIYDVDSSAVEDLVLKDIEIKVLGRSQNSIGLGDLKGNEFEINVRNLNCDFDSAKEISEKTTSQIIENGGVPNFFGIQRFGAKRPITHKVGKDILLGNMHDAVFRYICELGEYENSEVNDAREFITNTGNLKEGITKFPSYSRHEKALISHIISNPGDYTGAFKCLPKNLYLMFVHAYQSQIFNKIISERIKQNIPLNEAVLGDIVCYRTKDNIPDPETLERVSDRNISGINNLIKRNRAFVTAPLFGYDTPLAKGIPGEIESKILEAENISADMFHVPHFPEVASSGLRKEILLNVNPNCKVETENNNENNSENDTENDIIYLNLKFSLPKGSYATTVLREYMKTNPLFM
ncbi:MAG: tRNA pseudouridine(13) synthase TruD [Methanosarcinaceae archaeon]|nr:tRNA pseudouridine(13) synthase TruD [Methanosarcinaceae archaeon]